MCQAKPKAKQVTVVFDSDDYYKLITDHPQAVRWLSLGRNVQLVIGDTIYSVVDKPDQTDTTKKKAAK